MSQSRMKTVFASLGLFLVFTSGAYGQVSQMRLFSPYPDDQFGGGAYMREGLYGSVGAGLMTITHPGTQTVGYTDWGNGNYDRPYYLTNTFAGNYTFAKMGNQVTTSQMKSEFTSATQFEIGKIEGHHGWSVKADILTPQTLQYSGFDGSIEIADPRNVSVGSINLADNANYYIWNVTAREGEPANSFVLLDKNNASGYQIGHLWAIIDLQGGGINPNQSEYGDAPADDGPNASYALAPIPLIYDRFSIDTSVNYWNIEAMYTYRFHPFRRGTLEFLAGMRYTTFDDTMKFMGHATTKLTNIYSQIRIDILNKGGSTNITNGVISENQNQEYDQNQVDNEVSSGTDLGYSSWAFEAQNHIVGPQVGGRYVLSNNRWRYIAEGKFFAGYNRQNIYGNGYFGFKPEATQSGNLTGSTGSGTTDSGAANTGGLSMKAPLLTTANSFDYVYRFNEFTPGGEFKLEAAWYWTEAVSFKAGYNFTCLGNIARGSSVNDYKVNDSSLDTQGDYGGTYFDIQKDRNRRNHNTLVHGVMFTAQINK